MGGHPLVLADVARARQFLMLGHGHKLFTNPSVWRDADGVPWLGQRLGGHGLAVTALGPGWVFDPYARQRKAAALTDRFRAVAGADDAATRQMLDEAAGRVRPGVHAERLLWAVHRAVL